MVNLRPYKPADASGLLALFRDTIRRVNSRDYSPEQIRAWASDEIDLEIWANRFTGRFALVAEEAGQLLGFVDLTPEGHLDRLFVSADHQRRGIGVALMQALLDEAQRRKIARLTVEASITARPFFEAHGFTILARQEVACRGTMMTNFRMERILAPGIEPTA